MKRTFIAFKSITALVGIAAFAATTMPAQATTFSTPRLIYIAAGVADWNSPLVATVVPCANLSGQNATIKWTFIRENGVVAGIFTATVAHGRTTFVSTENGAAIFGQNPVLSAHDFQGRVSVASTQSGVFCSALLAHSTSPDPQGMELHLVRFNAHPGTVE